MLRVHGRNGDVICSQVYGVLRGALSAVHRQARLCSTLDLDY